MNPLKFNDAVPRVGPGVPGPYKFREVRPDEMGPVAFPKPAPRCKHRWGPKQLMPPAVGEGQWWKRCQKCSRTRPAKPPKPVRRGARPKATKPPKRVSSKRRKQLGQYARQRVAFLATHTTCFLGEQDAELCERLNRDETPRPLEVDHTAGRRGERLLDEKWWAALHPACHRYVTDHAAEWHGRFREALA